MDPERREFLNLRTLPVRLLAEEVAWLLGFTPHDIPILTTIGLLKPLGRPPKSGVKHFATVTILELRNDTRWLARASDAVVHHWYAKNASQSSRKRPKLPGPEGDRPTAPNA